MPCRGRKRRGAVLKPYSECVKELVSRMAGANIAINNPRWWGWRNGIDLRTRAAALRAGLVGKRVGGLADTAEFFLTEKGWDLADEAEKAKASRPARIYRSQP